MPSSIFLILDNPVALRRAAPMGSIAKRSNGLSAPLAREWKDAGSLRALAPHPSNPSIDLVSRIIAWWGE
jgi:hypothetical protein